MKTNRENRMETLQANGMSTDNYLSMDALAEVNADDVDETMEQIMEDGYVRNTKLHRRWIMAQTFRALNYEMRRRNPWGGVYARQGWNDYVNDRYAYEYQFTMMEEELRVLCKLAARDNETFVERSHFFTPDVVVKTCEDYMKKLKKYVKGLEVKKCKNVPYVRVMGTDIFVHELDKKLYKPVSKAIRGIKDANSYPELYKALQKFNKVKTVLPYDTSKSTAWKDAFKGAGAFYTLKNLIMFHGCRVYIGNSVFDTTESMNILNERLEEYQGAGWRMFAFMNKLIADNQFDFNKRMKEIYSEN